MDVKKFSVVIEYFEFDTDANSIQKYFLKNQTVDQVLSLIQLWQFEELLWNRETQYRFETQDTTKRSILEIIPI